MKRVCGGRKQETEGQRASQGKEGEGESKTGKKEFTAFQRALFCRDRNLKGLRNCKAVHQR